MLSLQDENRKLRVLVRDDGFGIPEEKIQQVFDGGAIQSTSVQVAGAHVGLSHCKRLAEKSGNTLSVKNIIPNGAEFEFITQCFAPSRKPRRAPSAEKSNSLLEKTCVLIEDNAVNMKVMRRLVQACVADRFIHNFPTATLALPFILQNPDVSFVISDQSMVDNLEGSVFFKMLKVFYAANAHFPFPECAIATGDAEIAVESGIQHITKPVSQKAISAFFDSKKLEKEASVSLYPVSAGRVKVGI